MFAGRRTPNCQCLRGRGGAREGRGIVRDRGILGTKFCVAQAKAPHAHHLYTVHNCKQIGKYIVLHTFELELDDIMELETDVGDAGVSVC